MRGRAPSPANYSKWYLADEDGLAASLFDGFLSGFGKLVRVDSDGGLDLSIIENLD
jgi:hypothetical protein